MHKAITQPTDTLESRMPCSWVWAYVYSQMIQAPTTAEKLHYRPFTNAECRRLYHVTIPHHSLEWVSPFSLTFSTTCSRATMSCPHRSVPAFAAFWLLPLALQCQLLVSYRSTDLRRLCAINYPPCQSARLLVMSESLVISYVTHHVCVLGFSYSTIESLFCATRHLLCYWCSNPLSSAWTTSADPRHLQVHL